MNSPKQQSLKKETLYHYFEGLNDIRKAKHVVLYEGFDVISSYQRVLKLVLNNGEYYQKHKQNW